MFEQRPTLFVCRVLLLGACMALAAGCNETEQATETPVEEPTAPPAPTAPVAPTVLNTAAGDARAELVWSASVQATSYQVKRSTSNGGPYSQIATVTAAFYTDAPLVNGTTYYYVVSAVNAGGASGNSVQAAATPVSTPPVVTPPPPPPVTPPTNTTLPAVAALTNVNVKVNGGAATIDFDTVDDAKDYRVYALPSNDSIQVASDGTVTIPNAIYRCAGNYQVPVLQQEDEVIQSNGMTTRLTTNINGYKRSLAEVTLGYVYTTPDAAAGLVPVYAAGNPSIRADDDYFYRFQASRDKKYTTSLTEYNALVATGWRDDGIVFYVPAQASAATKPILTNSNLGDPAYFARYYLNEGPELNSRTGLNFSTAFNVLSSPAAGSRPLMRVHYAPFAAGSHDELTVGQANFNRLRYQGFNHPAATLHYSGITAATTLVVEALDKGCPFQGNIAAQSLAAENISFGSFSVAHQAWYTIADLRNKVPNGEVFINGQADNVVGKPKAIARAYVNVAPQARKQMDWMSSAASLSESFVTLPCQVPDGNCFQQFHMQSNTYDISFMSTETNRYNFGYVQGEFLLNYADWAADTNGKFRMTVRNQKATIAANTFAHATMEVNAVSSGRRYPQLILSDQNIPVQYNMINGRSLILQTFGDFPSRVDLEICDHQTWDVNTQCPRFILRHKFSSTGAILGFNPMPEEDQFMATVDGTVKFDLYASNTRAYILVNDKPYACANLTGHTGVSPAPVAPTGPVTVTFGDALYHSGVDDNFAVRMTGGFIHRHQLVSTSRHYDNLGFSSGVAAPAWDEVRMPCSSTMTMLGYDPSP